MVLLLCDAGLGSSNGGLAGGQKKTVVRTNTVAPIIIRNCKEEYQAVSDFSEPIISGRLADHLPEHAFVKVRGQGHRDWGQVKFRVVKSSRA